MEEDIFDFALGCVVGILSWFFGGVDGFLQVLLTFTIIDYISGVAAAYVKHELSSEAGFNGIARKVCIFALVGVAHVIDNNFFGDTETLKTAVCLFYIGNEGISILENAVKLGLKVPDTLKEKLIKLAEKEESHEKQNKKRVA